MASEAQQSDIDPADRWFHCYECEVDFKDPHAQIQSSDTWPDRLFATCGKCGRTIEEEVRDL